MEDPQHAGEPKDPLGPRGPRDPRRRYRTLAADAASAAEAVARRGEKLVVWRIGVFVALLAALALADPLEGAPRPLAVGALVLLLAVFYVLVRVHRRLRREEARHRTLERLAHLGISRMERDWEALEEPGLPAGPALGDGEEPPPFAEDLDLFGRASLFRILGPVTTAQGRATLTRWLLDAPGAADATRRQNAVRALAPAVEWRHELAADGLEGEPASPDDVAVFLEWAESPPWIRDARLLRLTAWVLPPVSLLLITLHVMGVTGAFWLLPIGAQLVIQRRISPRIAAEVEKASRGGPGVRRYGPQLGRVARVPGAGAEDSDSGDTGGDATLLRELRDALASEGERIGDTLLSLRRRLDFAESRANAYYRFLDAVLLLEIRVYGALEAWKVRHGAAVREWLEVLGRAEALAALAALAHDHPDWAWPEVHDTHDTHDTGPGDGGDEELRVVARALGHPLLRPELCVRNDVEIGPPGTFLLVTGSNMSGKSTLLRAVGANAVLARAGAPVCAEAFSLPVVRLRTSMMVGDSLADGVSRFMAELLRLKGVVDATREPGPPVLYLLDEILQGTNTKERRIAARTVLRHLLDAGAVGAVTSHDLTLHQAPDLERRARTFHFRESVTRGGEPTDPERRGGPGGPGGSRDHVRLHFDYQLRPGLSTTTNALELLEAVGLGREDDE